MSEAAVNSQSPELYLQEEILLLALRDEDGFIASEAGKYTFALGGAILTELLLAQRIVVDDAEQMLVSVANTEPLDDPVLHACLEKMSAKRPDFLQAWVHRFAHLPELTSQIAAGLCRRGILRTEQARRWIILTQTIFPEHDPLPERKLIGRLRAAIFTDTPDVDLRTAALIALADSAGLLHVPFEKPAILSRKGRIASLTRGKIISEATRQAVASGEESSAIRALLEFFLN
jgi:hypothetical protein